MKVSSTCRGLSTPGLLLGWRPLLGGGRPKVLIHPNLTPPTRGRIAGRVSKHAWRKERRHRISVEHRVVTLSPSRAQSSTTAPGVFLVWGRWLSVFPSVGLLWPTPCWSLTFLVLSGFQRTCRLLIPKRGHLCPSHAVQHFWLTVEDPFECFRRILLGPAPDTPDQLHPSVCSSLPTATSQPYRRLSNVCPV